MRRGLRGATLRLVMLAMLGTWSLTGCGTPARAAVAFPAPTPGPSPTAFQPAFALPTPVPTYTPTPVPTPTATPTPLLVRQGPGEVVCPILLYHHVDVSETYNKYYVTPVEFAAQMQLLHDLGYQTITVTQLARAIREGADLPKRPVVISFDDGQASVYFNAFPIMRAYGYVGTLYLVGNYLDTPQHLSVAQVRELAAAGWEVGSHSLTHADLSVRSDLLYSEVRLSRLRLEEALGLPVQTFAYPYGRMSDAALNSVRVHGYSAAVGLGAGWSQRMDNLYYLQRRPVDGGVEMQRFLSWLPWQP